MIISIVNRVFFPIFTGFVVAASIALHATPYPAALLLCGLALFFTSRQPLRGSLVMVLHIALLTLFHWLSHMNWCYSLYMITLTTQLYRVKGMLRSFILSSGLIIVYTIIRLTYSKLTTYNIVVSFSDLLTTIIFVLMIRFIFDWEAERSQLREEKSRLSMIDPLTGLLNYSEYHRRLELLTQQQRCFTLYLIDCRDFKSKNIELGYVWGNETLTKIGSLLRSTMKDALFIARSGGDEFALAIDPQRTSPGEVHLLLDDHIPLLLGVHMLHGSASFPEHGTTQDELVVHAEEELYDKKRAAWLKREEAMFRSEKLRTVGELAAGMAHEIRNPLTTIKGFLQVARQNDYRIEPYYETIMDEIGRMSELTAEFLQFSRPHATQHKPQLLQDCLDRVLSLTNSEALRLGHQLLMQKANESLWVRMDKDKIVQVLLNLVKNAFEAMDRPGTIAIALSRAAGFAVIQIHDTGTGIPEDGLEKIFQPFYTSKASGTGLGLSICQKIIHDHGGTIEVTSIMEEGTTFTIRLPVIDMDTEKPSP